MLKQTVYAVFCVLWGLSNTQSFTRALHMSCSNLRLWAPQKDGLVCVCVCVIPSGDKFSILLCHARNWKLDLEAVSTSPPLHSAPYSTVQAGKDMLPANHMGVLWLSSEQTHKHRANCLTNGGHLPSLMSHEHQGYGYRHTWKQFVGR
jgi:hypothetical protein